MNMILYSLMKLAKTTLIKKHIPQRKTDIIATLGYSTEPDGILEQMILHGMTIARINMSHSNHEEHHKKIMNVRALSKKLGIPVKILVDLSGPKIRLGFMEDNTVLAEGSTVTITTKPCLGNAKRFSISYKKLPQEVRKGQYILLIDGKRKLQVISTNKSDEIVCKVITGGLTTSRRGVNVPGAELGLPAITAKDKLDMQFGVDHNADYIALSFVRSVKDIKQAKMLLKTKGSSAKLVSKIETLEAINRLEDIVKESDMVMVARGDLAMEIGYENVPVEQKRMLDYGKKYNKPVIIATQMLDSMEKFPTPTRAEVSDIAGSIYGGASAIMVSSETTEGLHPIEVIEVMNKVSLAVEKSMEN